MDTTPGLPRLSALSAGLGKSDRFHQNYTPLMCLGICECWPGGVSPPEHICTYGNTVCILSSHNLSTSSNQILQKNTKLDSLWDFFHCPKNIVILLWSQVQSRQIPTLHSDYPGWRHWQVISITTVVTANLLNITKTHSFMNYKCQHLQFHPRNNSGYFCRVASAPFSSGNHVEAILI